MISLLLTNEGPFPPERKSSVAPWRRDEAPRGLQISQIGGSLSKRQDGKMQIVLKLKLSLFLLDEIYLNFSDADSFSADNVILFCFPLANASTLLVKSATINKRSKRL